MIPGLFGVKLFGLGSTAILGLIASGTLAGGLLYIKHDLQERGRKEAIAQIQAEQEEFNRMVQAEADEHDVYLDGVYQELYESVAATGWPEQAEGLPVCPVDCVLQ